MIKNASIYSLQWRFQSFIFNFIIIQNIVTHVKQNRWYLLQYFIVVLKIDINNEILMCVTSIFLRMQVRKKSSLTNKLCVYKMNFVCNFVFFSKIVNILINLIQYFFVPFNRINIKNVNIIEKKSLNCDLTISKKRKVVNVIRKTLSVTNKKLKIKIWLTTKCKLNY